SSNPSPGGVCTGLGVSPRRIDKIIGIVKAYTTRVGEGPFPTELDDAQGEFLREQGGEYGATTGRPRRCGWFDAPVVRHAVQLAGLDEIIITKLDVLDSLERIPVCAAYDIDGDMVQRYPLDRLALLPIQPLYDEMEGWKTSISDIRSYDALPENTRKYLERLEQLAGCPISAVSVGQDRGQIIRKTPNFLT
ncbi:MAG: adenylosuccinate synthetase, partial [Candidatus Sumerlaeota bacterium]|nr:adenylosuccinate synthetase [Candidatus Sumerlaeota bacterium]